ncbi:allophanate hydrolase, partial [uncultured Pseudomonas sp.]
LSGARAYLAAPAGFVAPQVLGSCATVAREQLGGPDGFGRGLVAGDELTYAGHAGQLRELPCELQPVFSANPALDVVMGAQMGAFSGQSTFDAFNSAWTLDTRADRMGIRLLGPALVYQGAPMISEGIPLGAIQVPPDGQPIVLLNDRQTIGGYPRLGALTPLALARLAQCLPGEGVHMRPTTQEAAQRQHVVFMRRFVA